MVACLLAGGADPEVCDRDGRNPLHVVAEVGCEAVARLLIREGVDLNAGIRVDSHNDCDSGDSGGNKEEGDGGEEERDGDVAI